MKFSRSLIAAAAAAALVSVSAFADQPVAPDCESWSSAATAYTACTGFLEGNNSLTQANAQGFGTFAFDFKDNQTSQGSSDTAVIDVWGDASSIKVTFNQAIVGEFVVSLKLGNFAAYYDFDTAGIGAGETLTFTGDLEGYQGYGLSHASVYSNTPAIPEPETYALMLAGLGAVGFMARRRRRQG